MHKEKEKDEKKLELQATTVKKANGELEAIASDETVDRVGDKLKIEDWDLKNFLKNPVLQAGHDYRPQFTIGIAENIRVEGKKLKFTPVFHDITELSRNIGKMYKDGYLTAWSVGFIPRALQKDEDGDPLGENELLEISAVAVPANPNALTSIKGLTKDAEDYPDESIEKVKEWVDDEVSAKPFPNEHACRLRNPDSFEEDSFKSTTRTSDGKKYRVIMGKLKGDDESFVEQSYRYNKDVWSEDEAKEHCKDHDGKLFEPATEAGANESETENKSEEEKEVEAVDVNKGVIPYKETGKAAIDTAWNGSSEIKEAEVSDLVVMCGWYDDENPDVKSSYKLPHHKAEGTHLLVWKGLSVAMGALLDAKSAVDIPDGDRKGIYNHLAKHYKEFDKEPPEFKEYSDEELKTLEEKELILMKEVENKKEFNFKEELEKFDKSMVAMYGEEYEDSPFMELINQLIAFDGLAPNLKEGRVISSKNRKTITDTISKMKDSITALEKLLELSESSDEGKDVQTPNKSKDSGADTKGRKPKVEQKSQKKTPSQEEITNEIIVRALQKIAKNSNFALNKIKNK